MKQHLRLMAIAITSTLLFAACKKDKDEKVEETPIKPGINYQLSFNKETTPGSTGNLSEIKTGVITWTSGYATVSNITMEATKDGQLVELKSDLSQRVDIFKLITTVSNFDIPAGTYQNIKFKTSIASSPSHHAFELKGSYQSNGTTTPIVVRVTQPVTFEVEHAAPVTINAGEAFIALNKLDLAALTSGITEEMLNNAVRNNGTIVITHYMNSNMYFMIGDIINQYLNIEVKKG